jgi:DNA-binding MarR family transcriptional regulator
MSLGLDGKVQRRNVDQKVDPGGSAALRVEELLCFALYVTARASEASYRPVLSPLGLTYPRYIALVVLSEQDDLTVKALGKRLHLDSGTLTPLIKGMEADGHVSRQRDPLDERLVRVTLTQKGRDLSRIAIEAARSVACGIDLSPGEVKRIRDDVIKVLAALQGAQSDR